MEHWMALAARQHGVITRAQLHCAEIPEDSIRWRVGAGSLELVVTGVYRLGGATRSWEQRLAGACLWGGPGACASHRAAGALWGFDGFGPGAVEVSTPKQTRRGSLSRCIGPRSIRPWSRRSWGFRFTNA